MQMIRIVASLVFACVLLSGCALLDSPKEKRRAVVGSTPLPAEVVSGVHASCEAPHQEGCLELVVGNYQYDQRHSFMRSITRSVPRSDAEGQRRLRSAGQILKEDHRLGLVRTSVTRTFVVCVYNAHPAAPQSLSAYQYDGRQRIRHRVADITREEWKLCPLADGARANRVYRIVAFGGDPHAAAIQVPWSMVTSQTFIMICSEDKQNVFPAHQSATDSGGFWYTPEELAWLRSVRKARVDIAFVSR